MWFCIAANDALNSLKNQTNRPHSDGRSRRVSLLPHALFVVLSVIWGSNFVLMKKAGMAFGPVGIGAWRVFGGALVLGMIWWIQAHGPAAKSWPLRRRDWGPLWILALVSYAWPFVILPWLIQRHGGAFAGMMISLVPLLTILVSVPMLRIYPTRRETVAVLLGLCFFGLLVQDGLTREVQWFELLAGISVPLCYAIGNTYLKRRLSGIPSLVLSCAALALATVLLMPLALALPMEQIRVTDGFGIAVTALTTSSILATGIATFMFYKLIQDHGPLFAGMTAYLIPLGALIWGWVDHEQVTLTQTVALVGILGTVAWAQLGATLTPVLPNPSSTEPEA